MNPLSLATHPRRMAQALAEAEDQQTLERLASLFKAMGEVTRLKILTTLRGGEMCVSDLAALLGVSDSAVSQHLRLLKYLALVKCRRQGQCMLYSLDDQHLQDILGASLEHLKEK